MRVFFAENENSFLRVSKLLYLTQTGLTGSEIPLAPSAEKGYFMVVGQIDFCIGNLFTLPIVVGRVDTGRVSQCHLQDQSHLKNQRSFQGHLGSRSLEIIHE